MNLNSAKKRKSALAEARAIIDAAINDGRVFLTDDESERVENLMLTGLSDTERVARIKRWAGTLHEKS